MNESAAREVFDQKERARIRRSLRRYMEEHRVGTPTLQRRIEEADARRRELPLSTLQRFVAGSHRTSDSYVDMCARFLESVGVSVAAGEIGEALAGYFGGQDIQQARKLAAVFAGTYLIHADPWDRTRAGGAPYADVRFDHEAEKPYLVIAEEAHDMHRQGGSPRRHRYEGTLVFSGHHVHGFLRSCLTRQPKTYTLRYPGPAGTGSTLLEGAVLYTDTENEIRQLAVRLTGNKNEPLSVKADEALS